MSSLGLGMSEEPDRGGRRPRRGGSRAGVLAVLVSLLVVAGVLGVGYVGLTRVAGAIGGIGAPDHPGPGSGEVVVRVEEGDSVTQAGQRLEQAGVVASAGAFVAAARNEPRADRLQPGSYRLRRSMRASDALGLLLDPASRVEDRVTVPEGLRLTQTLDLLAKGTERPREEFERAVRAGGIGLPPYARGNAEGFLFPATYVAGPDTTAQELLTSMTRRYGQVAAQLGVERHPRFQPFEIVTIASLVEEEARRPEDFPRVARVIYNRLDKRMALQLDSTVNYVLRADKDVVFKKDIDRADSPYNTYTRPGLPPGPISSPGEAALRAALAPAAGSWTYFITTDIQTGETRFTDSYEQFQRLKNECKTRKSC